MKVLTIKQPFASLIAEGLKEYEFRSWKTNYRGEVLIHAGKSIDKNAMKKFKKYNLSYPVGCIIAKANLVDVVSVDDKIRNMLNVKNDLVYSGVVNDKEWNGYGFKLENIEKITPIEINGKLGFWNYDYRK